MAFEFVARNGVIALNNSTVTGSLNVTNGITGSLLGTSSFATTASFALNAGGAAAASNLIFSGSVTASVDVAGTTFRLISGSSTFLFVSRSGDIGIGTIIPTAKLQVSGTVNVVNFRGSGSLTTSSIFTVDGAAGRLFSVNDSLSGSLFSVNTIAGLPVIEAFSDNTVRIGQFGQRALFVSQSRVGINKETLLNANLDISGSAIISGSFTVISGSSREFQVTNIGVNIGNDVTDIHTLTGSLRVSGSITGSLLGTSSFATTASFALNAGGGGAAFPFTGSAVITGSLTVTGSVTATSIIETSALKYKQNIQTLGSGDLIYQLRPVTFDWITTQKSDIGFIAEEVSKIFPVLAEINENGEAEGVKYSKLTAILTKALQVHEQCLKEQQIQIDELKKEINVLKNN